MATNRASSASLNLWLGSEHPASARASLQNPITVSSLTPVQLQCMVECHILPEGTASCSAPDSVYGDLCVYHRLVTGSYSQTNVQEVARRMPGALLVVLAGLLVAVIQYPSVLRTLRFGPSMPQVVWPTWEEWKKGAAHPKTVGLLSESCPKGGCGISLK